MLHTVKIGTVATDNTASARVQLTFKYSLLPIDYLRHLQPIGKTGKRFWLHFKTDATWDRFFKLWQCLEKPFELRVNYATQMFYPPKGVK